MGARSGDALEVRQAVERHIHLARRSTVLEAVDVFEKIGGKMLGFDELVEREPRIDARRNCLGKDFVAISEDDAFRLAIFDNNSRDGGLCANLNSSFASRIANRIRHRSGSAASESPGAESAVNFSHVVMQQNVGGAG